MMFYKLLKIVLELKKSVGTIPYSIDPIKFCKIFSNF